MFEKHPERLNRLIDDLLSDVQEESGAETVSDFGRLWRDYVRGHAGLALLLFAVMAMWGPLPLILPLLGQYNVDHVMMVTDYPAGIPETMWEAQTRKLWFVAVAGAGVFALFTAFHLIHGWVSIKLAQRIIYRMREQLHKKLQALHVGFFDQTQTGRIVSRVLDDVAVIQQAITGQLGAFIACVSKLIIAMGIVWWINWRLALVIGASLPFYAVAFAVIQPMLRRNNIALSRMNSRMYGRTLERISAIKAIKAFGTELEEYAAFGHMNADFLRLGARQMVYNHMLHIIATVLQCLPSALILVFGMGWIRDALEGTGPEILTIGQLLAIIWTLPVIYDGLAQITNIATFAEQVRVRVRRVFALLDEEESVRPGTRKLTGIKGQITFRNVTFHYPHQREAALQNVTFTVKPGERVALMGPSGAGKTTIFQLLLRFYDPSTGEVEVGGINLTDADTASVRRHVRMVQQEPFIFSGTIAENIAYGQPDATPSQIMHAAKLAEMHELIMGFPDRYETEVGEKGTTLSGGQRQRLSLATALLTNPEVLLLDDTTSALDAETEARIRATLGRVMQGRTSLIITQRIATARDCDRIIVLENGLITQQGTHARLHEQDGFYRRICEQQSTL